MQKKRKFTRIEKALTLRYCPESGCKDNWNTTFVKNISEEGLLFVTSKQLKEGEVVLLMLKIPLDPYNWMETKGSVVESIAYASNSFLTRLKFICINDAQRDLLKRYVGWFLDNQARSSTTALQDDKRKSARIHKNLTVSYGIPNHLGVVGKWDISTVKNFSATGMAFTSNFTGADTIDFMIKIPSRPNEPLRIRARVIDSRPLRPGIPAFLSGTFFTRVEFIDLKDEQKKILCDYAEWLIKNSPVD